VRVVLPQSLPPLVRLCLRACWWSVFARVRVCAAMCVMCAHAAMCVCVYVYVYQWRCWAASLKHYHHLHVCMCVHVMCAGVLCCVCVCLFVHCFRVFM